MQAEFLTVLTALKQQIEYFKQWLSGQNHTDINLMKLAWVPNLKLVALKRKLNQVDLKVTHMSLKK